MRKLRWWIWNIKWYLLYGVRQWWRWRKYNPVNKLKIWWIDPEHFELIVPKD